MATDTTPGREAERKAERAKHTADTLAELAELKARCEDHKPPAEADWFLLMVARGYLRTPAARAALIETHAAAVRAHLFRWCNSAERPWATLDLLRQTAPRAGAIFWRVVAEEWTGFDAIPHAAYAAAFRRHRAAWSPDCMAPAHRAAWDALPPLVTLYRGQPGAAPPGLSWTLRLDVAEDFARGHRGIRVPAPAILRASVPREAVAFCSTERSEAEAVLFAPPAAFAVLPAAEAAA